MKIHIADPTGLCFGVRRAISKLEEELLRSGTVYSLGSPIHNPQETHRLTGMGLVVVESAEEVPAGSVAFIRAHGVTPLQADILMKKCRKVVDGMIILGGRNSANTKKLAEISMDVGVSTLWIEHAGEIDRGWLQNRDDIGIAAGGSTPDWLIKELIQKLNMM